MEDAKIVQMYWDRNPEAISVTAQKYGSYCSSIAKNILGNNEDSVECYGCLLVFGDWRTCGWFEFM